MESEEIKKPFVRKKSSAEEILEDIMQDQLHLEKILDQSKNEYFKELEKQIPSEPDTDDCFSLSFKYKNSKEEFNRKFKPDNTVADLKTYAKVKFRKNSDFTMYTQGEDGKILFDPNAKIKDTGIVNGDKIMINDEEDL